MDFYQPRYGILLLQRALHICIDAEQILRWIYGCIPKGCLWAAGHTCWQINCVHKKQTFFPWKRHLQDRVLCMPGCSQIKRHMWLPSLPVPPGTGSLCMAEKEKGLSVFFFSTSLGLRWTKHVYSREDWSLGQTDSESAGCVRADMLVN